jgi:hypothetical protein
MHRERGRVAVHEIHTDGFDAREWGT